MDIKEFDELAALIRQRATIEAEILIIEKRDELLRGAPRSMLTGPEAMEYLGLDWSDRTLRRKWKEDRTFPPPESESKKFASDHLIGWRDADDKHDYCEQFWDD